MTLDPFLRRLLSLMVALSIVVAATPLLPANAASDCNHMSISTSVSMAMDMKMDMKPGPAKSQKNQTTPNRPCNDCPNCLGGAGCAVAASDQRSPTSLPDVGTGDANWIIRLGGPPIAHKPALPPPIVRV